MKEIKIKDGHYWSNNVDDIQFSEYLKREYSNVEISSSFFEAICRGYYRPNREINMKRFSSNNFTLVFFQKDNDQKFSFYIENEKELTEQLLATVKTKRVKENNIKYAVNGIFDLIENNLLTKKETEMEKNPIIELAKLVQRQYGANIETRVTGKYGPDHMPTVNVQIELPDGRIYEASGTNKKIAKQKAAEKALSEYYKN
jgi:hypothetical protein